MGAIMLILSAADVRRAAPMPAAIDAVASAFAQLSAGLAAVPLRVPIGQAQHDSHTFFMPALLAENSALGLKVVSVFPYNQERYGLPSIHALVMLFDAGTGVPLAAMDGTYLTALRTGASAGVATRVLARPGARVLAMFGAGAQAPYQVQAVCAVRPIERVVVVNRSRARAEQLLGTLHSLGIPADCTIADSARAALAEADVVCCATSAPTPLFDDADVRPGTHINGVGAYTPALAEVPPATIARAYVAVDQQAAAWAEAGDLIQARAAGVLDAARVVEIGAIVAGLVPGRRDDAQITFFKSVGNAVQDVAVGQLALSEARRLGLGTEVALA